MKRILLTLAIALVASAASAQYIDDLYGPIPAKKAKTQNVERAIAETSSAQNGSYNQYSEQYSGSGSASTQELITSYEQALTRRINALKSNVEQSESYWQLLEQYQAVLEKKYNQDLYNIVVVGSDMWVEPQSITALFDGTDPAAGVIKYNNDIRRQLKQEQSSSVNDYQSTQTASNITIQLNVVDRWDYGWYGSPYSYWRSPYYYGSAWRWGYPSYWGGGYYPGYWGGGYYPGYWGGGYYPPYYGHHGHHSYYGNPRGTYYGNSHNYRSSGGGSNGMGGGRSQGSLRANGNNTVYNGSSNRVSGGSRQSNITRPAGLGGVTTRPTRTESGYSRPVNNGSNVERPTNYSRPNSERRSTYDRPSTTTRTERSTTYDRPSTTTRTERSTTYERPSSPSSGGGYSRPSGGSGGSGGGMGGGRSGGRR